MAVVPHLHHLACLENVNMAQVQAQPTSRQDPYKVISQLCSHEVSYLSRNFYQSATDPLQESSSATPASLIVMPHMREVLGLWMCQICVFREVDVFPTAINLSDRFFALFPLTSKDQIQLVGATSLQLASKLRETVPVSTEEVLFFTDDAYAAKDLKAMETIILDALLFDVISVTPGDFLDAFLTFLDVPMQFHDRVKADALRRINIALIGTALLSFKPSCIAAACVVASLSSAGLSVNGSLLENLCHAINCEQNTILFCMEKSVEAWAKHYSEVYEAGASREDHADTVEEEESDSEDDESDIDMDEGVMVDCSQGSRASASDLNDYLMDSDSGIQEDFLLSGSRHLVKMPSEYYSDSDDSNSIGE